MFSAQLEIARELARLRQEGLAHEPPRRSSGQGVLPGSSSNYVPYSASNYSGFSALPPPTRYSGPSGSNNNVPYVSPNYGGFTALAPANLYSGPSGSNNNVPYASPNYGGFTALAPANLYSGPPPPSHSNYGVLPSNTTTSLNPASNSYSLGDILLHDIASSAPPPPSSRYSSSSNNTTSLNSAPNTYSALEKFACSICLENFSGTCERACLNSCNHLLCVTCVTTMLDHSNCYTNNHSFREPKCPVCQKGFRRYSVLSPDGNRAMKVWRSEGFYRQLQERFLKEMYQGFFYEHRLLGYDSQGVETMTADKIMYHHTASAICISIRNRIEKTNKVGSEWVENLTDLLEAFDFFLTPATKSAINFSALRRQIHFDPLVEEMRRNNTAEAIKRENLRKLALEKERTRQEQAHQQMRKKMGKKETKKNTSKSVQTGKKVAPKKTAKKKAVRRR